MIALVFHPPRSAQSQSERLRALQARWAGRHTVIIRIRRHGGDTEKLHVQPKQNTTESLIASQVMNTNRCVVWLCLLFFNRLDFSTRLLERHLLFFPRNKHTHTHALAERWKMLLSELVTPGWRSFFFFFFTEVAPQGLMWEWSGDRAGLTSTTPPLPKRMGLPDQKHRRTCASGRLNSCLNAQKCADKGH